MPMAKEKWLVRIASQDIRLLILQFQTLENIVYYVILAPHNNEQSDMLHRLYNDPALEKLELQ
jgi:hypothetical protein